jgi:hypothetical protein
LLKEIAFPHSPRGLSFLPSSRPSRDSDVGRAGMSKWGFRCSIEGGLGGVNSDVFWAASIRRATLRREISFPGKWIRVETPTRVLSIGDQHQDVIIDPGTWCRRWLDAASIMIQRCLRLLLRLRDSRQRDIQGVEKVGGIKWSNNISARTVRTAFRSSSYGRECGNNCIEFNGDTFSA